ncbi:helix-turn-helix transcriptional regulator [Amorphoplanes nipponensis]|uniref:LuxR family transcriptional regulator n=1 Tax=Actinoplanes nipponensis TaxID=135950 RepID=A0A919MS97_9ACTN|nr:LuxR family transcriptional regulator [Actinoplanes nipponensis]GIE47810.1 LuxR family transcriptional regulator [Actinoplanes nipponensis]
MRAPSPVLVGRGDLLALADRRLAAAADGHGELLFLAGEAGIGKTRLLTEMAARAAARGFTVVGAAAFPGDADVAGGLITDALSAFGTGTEALLRGSPDGDSHRRLRLLVTGLADALAEAGAGPRPVLMTLEDLHWADDLTLQVLARLAHRLPGLPMLVVGTYRSDELYPRVPMREWRVRLLNQRHAEEARLSRLGPADTAALAAAISDTVLPAAVTRAVFARSDGIPLHVEEFLATVGAAGPPDTLAEAVLARAASLSAPARSLAGAASVIGRSFDVDLLTAITGERPDAIDAGLRELAERFFVRPHADGFTYDFRHALIREALHADLPPLRRRDLHARTAEAALAAGLSEAFVSDQYERAHRPAEAHRHALAAAAGAVRMSAHREAVELYRRALRTAPAGLAVEAHATLLAALGAELAAVDDNEEAAETVLRAYRMRLELGDAPGAAALVPELVAVRHLLGAGLAERTGLLRDGLDLIAHRAGERAGEIRAGLHAALAAAYMLDRRLEEATEVGVLAEAFSVADCDHPLRCHLGGTLGSILVFGGRMHEGWQMLENAIGRARRGGLEAEAARGYRMLGSSASVLVEYDRARRWLAEGIGYADSVERFNDRHYMAAHLAHVDWARGDWAAAEAGATRALADGQGITTRITALHVLGYVALGRGRWDAATRSLREAAGLGEAMGELQRISPAWWGLASMALLRGDAAEAIRWCERGYAASARVRDAAYLFPYVVTGVRAYLTTQDLTGARDWLARSGALLRDREIPGTLGALDHGAGLIHLHEGQTGKARAGLERAAAFWRERGRFWEGTQAVSDQARCAHRSRRPGEAGRLSELAAGAAEAAGATVLRPATAPASTRTTAAAPPSGGARARLTAREAEVAGLIREGATNREIAAALAISPKTVSAHVEHILTKLGAARRAQIATWAATHR